jgi:hypothetical protein
MKKKKIKNLIHKKETPESGMVKRRGFTATLYA